MSDTSPPILPPSGPSNVQHPAELFLRLIITLLTPMFLASANGDLDFARAAAAHTLEAYRAQTHSDLITVAKIIAFGIATLGSLTLSMAEDLSVSQILRLRASANATDRSEHRNRLALTQERAAPTPPEREIDEAALAAAAEVMKARTAENLARFSPPNPAPRAPPAHPDITDAEKQYQATWAASAATVAAETAASLPTLPPEERHSAAIWINVLNDIAKDFMDGNFPPRAKPGDLSAMMGGT
jgi:hypothetical protein